MQLMPETAQLMGVHNVFDANDNMRGGIRYFSEMLKRCGQNVGLALAA
jgi:soluble lytic murein transglycosylase-like protein